MTVNENDYVTVAMLRATLEDILSQINEHYALRTTVVEVARILARSIDSGPDRADNAPALVATPTAPPVSITLNVEPGAFTVENVVQPADVVLPARKTTTKVERDNRGVITKTTAVETDA
jgi:hypothetical protein